MVNFRIGDKAVYPAHGVAEVVGVETRNISGASHTFYILKTKTVAVDSTTWNRRYREYMEKIKTGSVFEIAAVLRDLYLLKYDKDLSFGERKMLDTARSLLVKELAIAKNVSENDIETDLKKIFNC